MRTTLTLDDDLAERLKTLARKTGTTFRSLVSGLIRRGLSAPERKSKSPYRIQVFSSAYRPGVDPLRLNQLVDDLEVERFQGTR